MLDPKGGSIVYFMENWETKNFQGVGVLMLIPMKT